MHRCFASKSPSENLQTKDLREMRFIKWKWEARKHFEPNERVADDFQYEQNSRDNFTVRPDSEHEWNYVRHFTKNLNILCASKIFTLELLLMDSCNAEWCWNVLIAWHKRAKNDTDTWDAWHSARYSQEDRCCVGWHVASKQNYHLLEKIQRGTACLCVHYTVILGFMSSHVWLIACSNFYYDNSCKWFLFNHLCPWAESFLTYHLIILEKISICWVLNFFKNTFLCLCYV